VGKRRPELIRDKHALPATRSTVPYGQEGRPFSGEEASDIATWCATSARCSRCGAKAKMRRGLGFCTMLLATLPVAAEAIEIYKGGNRAKRAVTCLVDGDTGWEAGVKWRLKGVDTPEYAANAECDREPEFAKSATYRMIELTSEGYSVEWLGEDDGSRELVRVKLLDGRDAGTFGADRGRQVPPRSGQKKWTERKLFGRGANDGPQASPL
jgi:hypothetical protein